MPVELRNRGGAASFSGRLSLKFTRLASIERKDARAHAFVSGVVSSIFFNAGIMLVILLSTITISLETTDLVDSIPLFFTITDYIFLFVFLVEFILRIYADPVGYWKNYYNLFDFFVLCVSALQTILANVAVTRRSLAILTVTRVLRAVRILRSVSFVRGLQVLVSAILATFLNAMVPLLFLLFLLMFIFSVVGYYSFGFYRNGDRENWGTFGRAMLSLFTYVTADGWTDIQNQLTELGFNGSEYFTIIFIMLGHFLFTNLFIGVIILNIHTATKSFDTAKKARKDAFIQRKRTAIIQKHHRDVLRVIARQIEDNFKDFHEMTEEFQQTLRHDDFTYSSELCTNKTWIDTFIATLIHLENSKYRLYQVHREIAQNFPKLKRVKDLNVY